MFKEKEVLIQSPNLPGGRIHTALTSVYPLYFPLASVVFFFKCVMHSNKNTQIHIIYKLGYVNTCTHTPAYMTDIPVHVHIHQVHTACIVCI